MSLSPDARVRIALPAPVPTDRRQGRWRPACPQGTTEGCSPTRFPDPASARTAGPAPPSPEARSPAAGRAHRASPGSFARRTGAPPRSARPAGGQDGRQAPSRKRRPARRSAGRADAASAGRATAPSRGPEAAAHRPPPLRSPPRSGAGSPRAGHRLRSGRRSCLDLGQPFGLVMGNERVDHLAQIAGHDLRQRIERQVDPVIGHAALREIVGADPLRPVA